MRRYEAYFQAIKKHFVSLPTLHSDYHLEWEFFLSVLSLQINKMLQIVIYIVARKESD